MSTVTALAGTDHPSPTRVRRRAAWIVAIVAVVIVAAGIPVAVLSMRGHQAQAVVRPELQRVLVQLTSGSVPIAPGATAYVAGPHGTWSGSAGVADVVTGQPMPVDARMRLESVSKIWTAVLVLQLAEQGRLGLDDTVERWLPGLLPFGDRITLRQLLTHTSGIFDNNDVVRTWPGSRTRGSTPSSLAGQPPGRPDDPVPTDGPGSGWPPPSRCTSRPAAATTTPTSASRSSGW